jgi:D-alanine transaminase/branched-chain amino acid aminotransferase
MSRNYVLINGDFVPKEEARILITDLAIQRGYGIFDFFKTVNNQPVFLDDYLDRFYFSAAELFRPVGIDRDALKKLIRQLIEKNNLPGSGIRITLTGGYSEDGHTPAKPNLLITQTAFTYNKENFEKGTRLVTYEHQRQLPHVKTIDYLQAIRLQNFIKENDADDVLYHGMSGISECPRSNFFIVTANDEIITPSKNVLQGITRKKILAFDGLNIKEGIVDPEQVTKAKEAFITSTTKMILPVFKINGQTIGNGKPGTVTKEIFKQLLNSQGIQ